MHFFINFPIADFRALINNADKLTSPVWPMPDLYKSFLRNFGNVQDVSNSGNAYWSGEDKFCDAHGIVKFQDLNKINGPGYYTIKPVYKRFYSDGYFMNKFEIGVENNEEVFFKPGAPGMDIPFEELISFIADLPVCIKSKSPKNTAVSLQQAGTRLARAYAESSTVYKKITGDTYKWVVAGEPLIVVTFTANEFIKLPAGARPTFKEFELLSAYGKVNLYNARLNFKNAPCKVWLIELPAIPVTNQTVLFHETIKNLRINLSRIHTEKEMIRLILNAIKTKKINMVPGSAEANTIETYLKKQSEKLLKKIRFDLPQKDLLDFALSYDNEFNAGSYRDLENEIELFEGQFLKDNLKKIVPAAATPSAAITPEIFFSYAWGGDRETIVDELYLSLSAEKKFILVRDKVDLGYKGLISDFMKRIGKGNFVIVVISDKYLRSEFCMFELCEVLRNAKLDIQELIKTIFPIKMEELNLGKPAVIGAYIKYWKDLENEWAALITEQGLNIKPEQQVKYSRIKNIATEIPSLIDMLADMNTLTPEMLSMNNFATIKNAIDQRMADMLH